MVKIFCFVRKTVCFTVHMFSFHGDLISTYFANFEK